MSEWFDTPGEVAAVMMIMSVIVGVLLWVVRAEVAQATKQLRPNGGKSLADAINRVERDVREVRAAQQAHLEYHLDQKED